MDFTGIGTLAPLGGFVAAFLFLMQALISDRSYYRAELVRITEAHKHELVRMRGEHRTEIGDIRAAAREEYASRLKDSADTATWLRAEITSLKEEISASGREIAALKAEIAAQTKEIAALKVEVIKLHPRGE